MESAKATPISSKMRKFVDLNVIDSKLDVRNKKKVLERAARLGYEVVAIDHKQTHLDRKTKIPEAPAKSVIESDYLKVEGKELKILSRLTVTLKDQAQTISLRSDSVSTYDILAVEPTSDKMFHKACTELEVDIISCDMTAKLGFYFKHHSIKPALERGVQFEINYSPAIRDQTLRRHVFHNALSLVAACKGRNIILTSGAEHAMELRGPHDVANLGSLFGLSEDKAMAAISANCEAAIVHGFTRNHTIKSAMSVQRVTELTPDELWKVKASLDASGLTVEKLREMESSREKKAGKRNGAAGDKATEPAGKKQRQR